jgi:hypothetical protein
MKKNEKKKILHSVAWRVTEEEMNMINVIKKTLVRRTNSDVLRVLVNEKHEKILNSNNPVGVLKK